VLLLAVPTAAAPSAAQDIRVQDSAEVRPVGEYAGVEPGEAQPPPALGRAARRRARAPRPSSILTWPGFTPLPDRGSRFFVQTTDPVVPELRVEEGRVVLLFRNTRIPLRTSARWLETRFFDTPVVRARLERRGRDMAFVLYLRAPAIPRLSTEPAPGGGFHDVYVDFAPGAYAPVPPVPSPPPAPAREVDPSLDPSIDDERPPALQ
jgi:hypothetical protein